MLLHEVIKRKNNDTPKMVNLFKFFIFVLTILVKIMIFVNIFFILFALALNCSNGVLQKDACMRHYKDKTKSLF